MDKTTIIKALLKAIGMPPRQQSDLCTLTLLAMAGLKEKDSLRSATGEWIRIHDVISFINTHYPPTHYAENSRETIRKQAMHHFRTAAIIEDNGEATNSPNYRYRITPEFLSVLCTLNIRKGDLQHTQALKAFLENHQQLRDIYMLPRNAWQKCPYK